MPESALRELDRAQFDRAVAFLEREQQEMQLSRGQRILYRTYTIFLWGFGICALGAIVARVSSREAYDTAGKIGFILVGLGAICLGGGMVVSLFNLPLVIKRLRRGARIRRLGFQNASQLLWRAHWESRFRSRLLNWLALAVGIIFVAAGLILLAGAVTEGWLFLVLGFPLLTLPLLRNSRAWLDMMSNRGMEIARLRDSLVSAHPRAGDSETQTISLPAEAVAELSRLERDHIARSRAAALAASATESHSEFAVLSSNQALDFKRNLSPEKRWKVQEALDELMLDPRPKSAVSIPATTLMRQEVPETGIDIVYEIDDGAHQLKLLSLRDSSATGAHANA